MSADRTLWVVIADGEHARVLVGRRSPGAFADTDRFDFHTLHRFDAATAHKRSADLGTDAPGRTFESGSVLRHAIAPRSDPHDAAKHTFAAWLGTWLNDAAQDNAFRRLMLVAPAHVLHDLRAALNAATSALIVGALQKDLMKTPDHEIGGHIAQG